MDILSSVYSQGYQLNMNLGVVIDGGLFPFQGLESNIQSCLMLEDLLQQIGLVSNVLVDPTDVFL